MRSQKSLRDDLQFVTEFATLFDVVQQTAMTQLRRLEETVRRLPILSGAIEKQLIPLLPAQAMAHPCLRGTLGGGVLMVVITSDEGMVGPLHAAVVQQARRQAGDAKTEWLFIGNRGLRLIGQGRAIPIPPEDRTEEQLLRLRRYVVDQYHRLGLSEVWLASPRYVSATHQEASVRRLLPLPQPGAAGTDSKRMVEPSLDRVVAVLADAWVESLCREAFWSARQADYAARAVHVEASRQELLNRSRRLRHEFFKTMHERVDVLVRETCVVQRQAAGRTGALKGSHS